MSATLSDSTAIEAAIQKAIRELDYGTVEITVHDAKVVQIEVKRRIRINNKTTQRSTAGHPKS